MPVSCRPFSKAVQFLEGVRSIGLLTRPSGTRWLRDSETVGSAVTELQGVCEVGVCRVKRNGRLLALFKRSTKTKTHEGVVCWMGRGHLWSHTCLIPKSLPDSDTTARKLRPPQINHQQGGSLDGPHFGL